MSEDEEGGKKIHFLSSCAQFKLCIKNMECVHLSRLRSRAGERLLSPLLSSPKLVSSLSGLYAMLLSCAYLALVFSELAMATPRTKAEKEHEARNEEPSPASSSSSSFHLEEDTGFLVYTYGASTAFVVYILVFALRGHRVYANQKVDKH